MEIVYIKCPILFYVKNKKKIINLLAAELAQRVVKVKCSYQKREDSQPHKLYMHISFLLTILVAVKVYVG